VPASRRGGEWDAGAATWVSALRCRPCEAGCGFDALAFDGTVDRGTADAEELGDLEVLRSPLCTGDTKWALLAAVELGLLAAQPTNAAKHALAVCG
jgi:hypothetical protein